MNLILLSGGSGKRLWPLSNEIRSKQFIKMFRGAGGYESMVQRVYRQIMSVDPDAAVTIATSKKQVSEIKNQLGDKVSVSVEPERRDTFPAIALAVAFLRDKKGVDENEAVVVCPVDPYVADSYFAALKELADLAAGGGANLTLMGIEPTYPSEKYGYILPCTAGEVSEVKTFREKPDLAAAKQYLAEGAVWNGGVFAFKVGYLLRRAHELIEFTDYDDLFRRYGEQKKISFDYAVVEHEASIQMMRYRGEWKDLGSWNTFTEAMDEPVIGKAILNETCQNTNVVNELNIPILCMGCRDMVVTASNDGILVSSKEQSSYIKPFVDQMVQQVRYAEKSWGSFTVLDIQPQSMTIKVVLQPNHRLNYHSHDRRDEVWTVIGGSGRVILDGAERAVAPGDVVSMRIGCRHTAIAGEQGLAIIETQLGPEIDVQDKHKFPLE